MSTDELPTRFAVEFFFSPTSCSSQESEGFFFRQATYKVTYVDAVEFRQGWSVAKNEENVKKRKEDDQGRWSVATRRRREKVHEKKETKEGKKVAPRVLGPWAAFKEQARLTSLL